LVAIISDIHFDLHDVPTWNAFKKWYKDVKPHKLVVLGDFLDLGMMSRYVQGKDEAVHAIPQIQCFVREINELVDSNPEGSFIVVEGNHDERWSKMILGAVPHVFKGAIGLTLKEQCLNQGLRDSVKWLKEDTLVAGVQCGPFMLRHGHNQQARFGQGKHLAATRISKTLGSSEVFGHYHRAQMHCQTALGKTAIAIANPCMTGNHDYNKDPDWQRGFTVLELYGPANSYATPYVVVMNNGHFAWHGKVYDGT
jgi:predicted phosphodiesterase